MRRRISTDNKVCFEPVRLLAPVKPAYNQSQPDSQLKLTASTTSQLWVGIPAVLVTVPAVMQYSLHPLSTSSITACCLLGKTTEADALTIRLDATPSIHIFMPNALSAATIRIYPSLGQAPNDDGLVSAKHC